MRHLRAAEVFWLTRPGGLDEQGKDQMMNHLKSCASCQKRLEEMETSMQNIARFNSDHCAANISLLPDYVDGEVNPQQKESVELHLKDCERCHIVLKWLRNWPAWNALAAQTTEIPQKVRSRIENKVLHALQAENAIARTAVKPEKLVKEVKAALQILKLVFRPVEPDFAFRGRNLDKSKVIEHPGSDLKLKTSLPDIAIELTSVFEDFQLNAKTDRKGEILFPQLNRGDYLVQISGFELEKMSVEVTVGK